MTRTLPPTALLLALALAPAFAVAGDAGNAYRLVEGGDFRSSVRFEEATRVVRVASFSLMENPVSNRDFSAFLEQQPQWRRDRIPAVFASPGYLGRWASADTPGDNVDPDAPVVHVNWYAADAYCRARQARLPRFVEWEYAAAADTTRRDARNDAAWRMRQVNDGTPHALDAAPDAPANAYGIRGLHGAHWEWSEDVAALLLQTPEGAPATIQLDYVSRMPVRRLSIVGDLGTVTWDLLRSELILATGAGIEERIQDGFDVGPAYVEAMRELVEAVRTGTPTSLPLEAGLAATRLAIAANAHLRDGATA